MQLLERFPARLVVIGLGAGGALLAERGGEVVEVPAPAVRPVVNTAGAGDALLACFLHYYLQGAGAREALRCAVLYASYKVGEDGSASGLLNEAALEALRAERSTRS
jgi:sugar/nucleoside kinase (ribokinase family)